MPSVEIGYSPNDFYYNTSGIFSNLQPQTCTNLLNDTANYDDKCCINAKNPGDCKSNWSDVSGICYNYEICKNKQFADLANEMVNHNSGSEERYNNIQKQFQNELLKSFNIIAGIGIMSYLSAYYFKT